MNAVYISLKYFIIFIGFLPNKKINKKKTKKYLFLKNVFIIHMD